MLSCIFLFKLSLYSFEMPPEVGFLAALVTPLRHTEPPRPVPGRALVNKPLRRTGSAGAAAIPPRAAHGRGRARGGRAPEPPGTLPTTRGAQAGAEGLTHRSRSSSQERLLRASKGGSAAASPPAGEGGARRRALLRGASLQPGRVLGREGCRVRVS